MLIIKDWCKNFETHETRKLRYLHWVPIPTKHDGKGYRQVMRAGADVYGAWVAVVAMAAKCQKRGELSDQDGPLSLEDISIKTDVPVEVLKKSIAVLLRVGWLEDTEKTGESPDVPGESPDVPGNRPGRTEGKGTEQKEQKENNFKSEVKENKSSFSGKQPPEVVISEKKSKVNIWCVWVDENRKLKRNDPAPVGPDTKAAKSLSIVIPEGRESEILKAFLADDDAFLAKQGHALRLLPGRINAYLSSSQTMSEDEMMSARAAEIAREIRAKRQREEGKAI